MERLTYTVSEVAQLLGISRSKAYELVAEGLIPVVPLPGRRKLVARTALQRLLDDAEARPRTPTTVISAPRPDDSPTARSTTAPPRSRRLPVPAPRPHPGPPLHTVAPGVRGRQGGRPTDDGASS